uniref:Uncharacterized protein n=1 Tax=Poecilia latipinna TaxID=48699 RepID=A0A3B3UGG0_9TELE
MWFPFNPEGRRGQKEGCSLSKGGGALAGPISRREDKRPLCAPTFIPAGVPPETGAPPNLEGGVRLWRRLTRNPNSLGGSLKNNLYNFLKYTSYQMFPYTT